MKRTILALVAATGLAVVSARADHVDFNANVSFGSPGYYAPSYGEPNGYWRDFNENVWVPPHWEVRANYWGRTVRYWEPGHYEVRSRRVWVDAWDRRRDREHWEHERWEHERREHRGRDWDDRDRR